MNLRHHRPGGPDDASSGAPIGDAAVASIAIALIEGRGIWLEVSGSLTSGSTGSAARRLGRIAGLGFERIVLDTSKLDGVDETGLQLLGEFAGHLTRQARSLVVVDPSSSIPPDRLDGASITPSAPVGAWWAADTEPAPNIGRPTPEPPGSTVALRPDPAPSRSSPAIARDDHPRSWQGTSR